MQVVYILECKSYGKIYVGLTSNLEKRFQEHVNGNGSIWTKKYGVEKLLFHINGDEFDELAMTLRMMKTYGMDNVRGSTYSSETLSWEEHLQIFGHFWFMDHKCRICGLLSHPTHSCNSDRTFDGCCLACGRTSHGANQCYAKSDCYGFEI